MATESLASILRRLRQNPSFSPVWSWHAEYERLPEYGRRYGIDKLSCERIIRAGAVGSCEIGMDGRETVHVSGKVDDCRVDVVVAARPEANDHVIVVVTLKPKP